MHEYDAQRWNIHAVCYTFIPLSLWPTVRQRINRERERESMVQIRGCVSSDKGGICKMSPPCTFYKTCSWFLIHQEQRTAVKRAVY